MKGLKKLALASAVAAAPFAQAELVAMDDAVLADMTGQAGVSIELETEITIGSVEYTDTDGLDNGAGSLAFNNITVGGATLGDKLDDIKIDIDVDGTDGLNISLTTTDKRGLLDGTAPVDFGVRVGSFNINGGANVASDIAIVGNLGPVNVRIDNDAIIHVDAYFQLINSSMNIDAMGVNITDLDIGDDSRVFIGNQDGTLVGGPAGSTVAQVAAGQAAAATITDADSDGLDDGTGLTLAETQDAAAAAVYDGVEGALGGTPGLNGMAYVGMTITTADTSYIDQTGATTNITDALSVSIDAMAMDIDATMDIGGVSIGTVSINDLDMSGTKLTIYGH